MGIKKEGNQWLLTYVVTLKVAKEETEIRQMKVAMEKKNNNYQVTEIPEEKDLLLMNNN